MTIKEWFQLYSVMNIEELKRIESEIKAKTAEVEEAQIVALNLSIVTKERNPDYSHMYAETEAKKKKKKEIKGQYVAGRGAK